jgi:tellurite resistance protein
MSQFFAQSLGDAGAASPNIFHDWPAQVEARASKRETAWSAPEAFLCILVGAGVCDREFADDERELVRLIAHRSRGLKSLTPQQLDALQWLVVDRLEAGLDQALEAACASLPDEIKLPAFAQALDIALMDGALNAAEAAYLDRLVSLLDLDPALSRPVANAIVIKNRC